MEATKFDVMINLCNDLSRLNTDDMLEFISILQKAHKDKFFTDSEYKIFYDVFVNVMKAVNVLDNPESLNILKNLIQRMN